jgi:Ca2+-transporting ATPase
MSGRDWGISIALGVMSIPIGFVIRMIPNKPCERFFILARILPDPNKLPMTHPQAEAERWDDAIERVRDNLMAFAILHGGRVRAICWPKPTYRRVASRNSIVRFGDCCAAYASSHKIRISKPSLLTMVPTLVATTICTGWVPQKGDLANLTIFRGIV